VAQISGVICFERYDSCEQDVWISYSSSFWA
jgi:hypothetical protein